MNQSMNAQSPSIILKSSRVMQEYNKNSHLPIEDNSIQKLDRSHISIEKAYAVELDIESVGVYYGETENDKPHGKGKMAYLDGFMYIGSFIEGKREGKGKYYKKYNE